MDGMNWRRLIAVGGIASLGFVAACSDDDDPDGGTTPTDTGTNPDAGFPADTGPSDTGPEDTGVTADAGFVRVNFTIDDSANQAYDTAAKLAWKGSFNYDPTTGIATRDPSWGGGSMGYPYVFDDGPWSAGGHEPAGATAGDSRWGIAMLVAVPTDADLNFEYGAVANWNPGSQGDWIWIGGNGTFVVPVGATSDITATGLTIPAFGTVDLLLTVDTSTLSPEFAGFDPANGITVKSSGWGWSEQACLDNGMAGDETAADDVFTFQLGENIGVGKPLRYNGKLKSGDEAQFVFVLGGVEYKAAGAALTGGVKAYVRAEGAATWTEVPVTNKPDGDRNTFVTIP